MGHFQVSGFVRPTDFGRCTYGAEIRHREKTPQPPAGTVADLHLPQALLGIGDVVARDWDHALALGEPENPAKAAQALLKLVAAENPPVRLYLGADALRLVEDKIEAMKAEIVAWEEVSRSTDFAS
ncbi:MAG TPA: hypothetical protein VIQ29_18255 [Ancylobacter sp.]